MLSRLVPLLLVVIGSHLAAPLYAGEEPPRVAIVNVTVVPMDTEHVLRDQTVLLEAGRILQIGSAPTTAVPDDAVRVDGAGRYLIPALADMHVHLLGEVWNLLLPPEARVAPEAIDPEPFLFPYIANGVTTVQVLSATPDHLRLRERIRTGEILGPRLLLARMIDAPERAWPPPLNTWVASPEEARQAVLGAGEAGYDAMKVYTFLDRARYDAIVETAAEIDMDVIGHVPVALPLDHVLGAGQRLIAHSEEIIRHADGDFSQETVDRLADTLAESDTWLVPTLVTSRTVIGLFDDLEGTLSRPEVRFFQHPIQQGAWSFMVDNLYLPIPEEHRQAIRTGFEEFQRPFVGALRERGVRLLAGTDSGLPGLVAGFSLHRELEELVSAGLTPYEALRTATTHPFEYLGESEEAGTVEVGKRADLVLLDANPLQEIGNTRAIAGVVIGGRWISRAEIEAGLTRIAGGSAAE